MTVDNLTSLKKDTVKDLNLVKYQSSLINDVKVMNYICL